MHPNPTPKGAPFYIASRYRKLLRIPSRIVSVCGCEAAGSLGSLLTPTPIQSLRCIGDALLVTEQASFGLPFRVPNRAVYLLLFPLISSCGMLRRT
jgi:hypothetical protein